MCSEPFSSQNIGTRGMVLFIISLNDPPLKILLSFSLSVFLANLECLVFKAEVLSQGHNIMVQLTLMLPVDYWAPPALKAMNKEES